MTEKAENTDQRDAGFSPNPSTAAAQETSEPKGSEAAATDNAATDEEAVLEEAEEVLSAVSDLEAAKAETEGEVSAPSRRMGHVSSPYERTARRGPQACHRKAGGQHDSDS